MKIIKILYSILWILALGLMFFIPHFTLNSNTEDSPSQNQYTEGVIIKIENEDYYVKLTEEKEVIQAKLNDFYFQSNDYREGDRVSLYVYENEEEVSYDLSDYYHLDGLILIFILFCALALWAGRKKGLFSIISVVMSLVFFYGILLGGIRAGLPILPTGIVYILIITLLTIPMIHGFNKKSLSAIISVNLGYIIGLFITFLFPILARIGSSPTEDFRVLATQFPDTNIYQVLILSLFLGATGAMIDVAVSICSAVFEGVQEMKKVTFKKVYTLGMNVGRDILGSMINTLLLAYMASSLPFLVLLGMEEFGNFKELLNYDFIALELTRIFIGAVSIVVLIPITAVLVSYFVIKNNE